MKLFLISQSENHGYDSFDSAVVAAHNEEEAKTIHPKMGWDSYKDGSLKNPWDRDSTWCSSPADVTAELIGTAKPGTKIGVICASFNAD